jgi:hypothetical protein
MSHYKLTKCKCTREWKLFAVLVALLPVIAALVSLNDSYKSESNRQRQAMDDEVRRNMERSSLHEAAHLVLAWNFPSIVIPAITVII